MLVSDHLVYLHLHKTACTYISETIKATVGGEDDAWPKHARMPEDFEPGERTVAISIRNPWDWYVSLWAFGCSGRGGLYNDLTARTPTKVLSQAVRHPSRLLQTARHQLGKPVEEWQRLYADPDDPALFREWLHRLLETEYAYAARGGFYPNPISRFAGLLTHRYMQLTTGDIDSYRDDSTPLTLQQLRDFDAESNVTDRTIRVESLEDDLVESLEEAGHALTDAQRREIHDRPPSNTSDRRATNYYYDERTRRLVQLREALIIEKFDYHFPG